MTFRTLMIRTLFLWVFLELLAAAQVRGPAETTILSSWARAVTTPPLILVESTVRMTSDLMEGIRDVRSLASENHLLHEELATLKSQNAALQTDLWATQQAAESLQALPIFSGTPARCLYRDMGRGLLLVSIDPNTQVIPVPDTPVLAGGGVVGRIIRVEGHTFWVETLTRATAAAAVVTLDGATHGLAEGTGGPELEIHFVSPRAALTVGQVLVTSGADGIYPPGFPVADITSVREGGGSFLEITARPRANSATIQAVWLVDGADPSGPAGGKRP